MGEPLFVDVGPRGRIVIPAVVRKHLGLAEGDRLAVEVESDGALVLLTRGALDARLQAMLSHVPHSLADELMAERRAEGEREKADDAPPASARGRGRAR